MKLDTVVIKKLTKNQTLTVHVRVGKEFKVRLWLAKILISTAAWVLGCGVDIDMVNL